MTPRCLTRSRSLTPSTWCAWPTPRSTKSAAESRTRPWDTEATPTTPSTGPGATVELVIGLTDIAGWLLVKCGVPENRTQEILQEIALKNTHCGLGSHGPRPCHTCAVGSEVLES